MKRIFVILLALIIFLIAGLVVWWVMPRVARIEPASKQSEVMGEGRLQGNQAVEIVFTRPMRPESVENRLVLQPSQEGEISWNSAQTILTFTPDQPWKRGEPVSIRLESGAKSKLGLPLLRSHTQTFEINPEHLAYLWPADGNSNLYVLDMETGESRALTAYPHGVMDFDISPDGMTLYYSVWHDSRESALYALNRLDGESIPILQCTQALCRSPKVSPNGRYLAYERVPHAANTSPSVRLYDLDDQSTSLLGEEDHFTDNASWSSEGWLAFYDHDLQAFLFTDPGQGDTLSFPNETGASGSWSPGGDVFLTSEILHVEEGLAPSHLREFSLEEGQMRDFTPKNYLEDVNPVYSPDGSLIAFERKCLVASCWSPGRQLWMMDSDGDDAHPLTDSPNHNHTAIVWHPEGLKLAYVRYNNAEISEPPEIWVINRSGSDNIRLIINGFAPRWLP